MEWREWGAGMGSHLDYCPQISTMQNAPNFTGDSVVRGRIMSIYVVCNACQ